jgi:hypothetical protein
MTADFEETTAELQALKGLALEIRDRADLRIKVGLGGSADDLAYLEARQALEWIAAMEARLEAGEAERPRRDLRAGFQLIADGAQVFQLLATGAFTEAAEAAHQLLINLEQGTLEVFGLVEAMKTQEDQMLRLQNIERLSAIKGRGMLRPPAPIPLLAAPSGRGGGGGRMSEAERTFNRVKDAVADARFELAELDAQTITSKAALESLKEAGLPFDRAELDRMLAGNAGLRGVRVRAYIAWHDGAHKEIVPL